MRVEFDPEVFTGNGSIRSVIKVMDCVAHGRHDWSADPLTLVAAERYFKIHAPTEGPTCLELGRKGSVAAAWRPPGTTALVRITLSDLADVAEDLC